jgi:hypothetical protein
MANTLTGLIPTIYTAWEKVNRNSLGLVRAVRLNPSTMLGTNTGAQRAAVGQTIRTPVAPKPGSSSAFTPGMAFPSASYETISYRDMTISKSQHHSISWQGEEWSSINQPEGSGGASIFEQQLQHRIHSLIDEVEADLAGLHVYASRAYGSAGTTPFATADDLTDFAETRRILKDNGCPQTDLHMVLNSAAIAKLQGKQSGLFHVNESGDGGALLRQGSIGAINGMQIHESAQILTSTAGTGASATTNAAGYAIGATTITLASAGTGTIVAGDVITFAGDTNKYVVKTGDADVSNGGTIVLAEPGLRKAIAASATNITVVAAAARNMAFDRDAIVLLTRAPAMPEDGDMAASSRIVTDPVSGISIDFRLYKGRGMNVLELHLAWGYAVIKPDNLALLLG